MYLYNLESRLIDFLIIYFLIVLRYAYNYYPLQANVTFQHPSEEYAAQNFTVNSQHIKYKFALFTSMH